MSQQIENKPLLGSPLFCDLLLRLLANGTDLRSIKCKNIFEQDASVAVELFCAGITVANSKFWWGRFREKEPSDIEAAIIGIPAERIRLAAAMASEGGNSGVAGGADANA